MTKFWYTVAIVFVLSRLLYYRYNGKRELLFTYILLSCIIAFLCILISRVEISLGFALGIFAIFGIIRYRTTQVSPREMTYLFLCTGTAAKNMLAPADMEFYRILLSDVTILLIAAVSEYFLFRKISFTKSIVYNKLELIHPDRRQELMKDLEAQFGISGIDKIKVGNINTAKKIANITVFFKDKGGNNYIE